MNIGDAEKTIMARLWGASERASPEQIAAELRDLDRVDPLAPVGTGSTIDLFMERLEQNGATGACVADRAAAVTELARYVASRHNQRRIVTGHDARLAALPWRDGGLLPRFGAAEGGEAVTVSYARDGIAETGSVVLWLDRDNPARNNLLSEDHVVLVDRDAVHRNLEALWRHAELKAPGRGPRGLMMISGPSSTADIGMHLVKGAHGPRALHVIVVGIAPEEEAETQDSP